MEWMEWTFIGRPISSWIFAGLAFIAIISVVPMVRRVIRRRWSGKDPADRSWRGLVGQLNNRWMRITTWSVALACAVLMLAPDPRAELAVKILLVVMLALQASRLVPVIVDWAIFKFAGSKDTALVSESTATTLTGLRWVILFIAYSLILLLALQNLGIDVTALIAGLGIGGIAIALALQNILGDLFASLTIALDKPFIVGDFIVAGDEMGTIEHVGLKTTRVRSLSGEQLVLSNADLLSSRIRNFKRMTERRVLFGFGVVYSTSPEILETIPSMVRAAIESQSKVRFDRCHFHRFGESSLDFEVVYYINSPDYNAHMDVQQSVHLSIARSFRDNGINFAYPTQTLYLAAASGEAVTSSAERKHPA